MIIIIMMLGKNSNWKRGRREEVEEKTNTFGSINEKLFFFTG